MMIDKYEHKLPILLHLSMSQFVMVIRCIRSVEQVFWEEDDFKTSILQL